MPTPVGYVDYAIRLIAEGDDEPYIVTFATEAELGSLSATGHADRMYTAFVDGWQSRLWQGVTVDGVTARVGQDGADDVIAESTLSGATGAGSGNYLPQNNAALVKKVSGLGGRKNQGRSFIPFVIPSAQVSNVGTLIGAWQTNLQTSADAFMDSLLDADPGPALQPVILHRTGLELPTPFSTYTVDSRIATQRERLRR